ncbi:MAG: GNAT family N-acetyltransferase [Pseudomonadota bacterium]
MTALPVSPLSTPSVPELRTERLLLRGYRLEDFELFAAMQADPVVMQHITGKPISRDDAWQKFARTPGHWTLRGFGYWAVCDGQTDEFLGDAGFSNFERTIEPSLQPYLEAGWAFRRAAHGRGLATEAMKAAIGWAAQSIPDTEAACMITPENTASIRVAEKCGFAFWCSTSYRETPVDLYRLAPLR